MSRVSRVANTNASAGVAARDRRAQQLQVGARVRLHRARDVAEQDQPARACAPAPPREVIGSPPVRMLARSVRRRSSCSPAARPPHAPLAPPRRRELQLGHHPPHPRQLVGAQRLEALLRPAAPPRSPAPAAPRSRVPSVALVRRGARAQRRRARPPRPRGAPAARRAAGGALARAPSAAASTGRRAPRRAPARGRRPPRRRGRRSAAGPPRRRTRCARSSRARSGVRGATSATARAKRAERSWRDREPGRAQPPAQRRRQAPARSIRSERPARSPTGAARPGPASPPRPGPGSAACRCGRRHGTDTARRRPR